MDTTAATPPPAEARVPREGLVTALIALVAAAAAAVFATQAGATASAVVDRPVAFAGLLLAACLLQLQVIEVPEEGNVSFASIGILAAAFYLGAGAAMLVAAAVVVVRVTVARARLDRGIFDVAGLALAAATAEATFRLAHALDQQPDDRFGPSVFAAALFYVVNVGLLSVAMGVAEDERPFQVWKHRFRWLAPWMLAVGPYAELTVVLYREVGIVGIAGMALMPFALVAPIRRRMYWAVDERS